MYYMYKERIILNDEAYKEFLKQDLEKRLYGYISLYWPYYKGNNRNLYEYRCKYEKERASEISDKAVFEEFLNSLNEKEELGAIRIIQGDAPDDNKIIYYGSGLLNTQCETFIKIHGIDI